MTLPLTDPVLIFALTMAIILLAPMLFVRLRMPGLVGLIVVGAVVGPSGLGLLARDATFELLGTVGLLYLMFTAGLSIDFEQFTRLRARSLTFGILSFLLPFGLALGVGPLLGYGWTAAVLLGAIVGSHTLLAYPLARRLGLDKHPGVVMAMGGTLVTDLLSLLLLAIITQVEAGATGAAVWVRFAALVTLFGAAVTLGLPRLGRWFFRTVRQQPDVHFVFLLAVVFAVAYSAGLVGLAPIIGAFLAGLVLNRLVPEQSPLMTRIRFVGDALFIPFFLLSVGMLVDLGALASSLDLWTVALAFIALVLVGKGLAAALAARLYRHTRAEALTLFGLSTPQAAATLAVTLVGFEIGLFSELAVNAVVLLILVTCLVGPFFVERFGREVARAEAATPRLAPGPQRILVALANPETAEELTDLALFLRDRDAQQPLYPMTVVREGPGADARVAAGEAMLGQAVLHAAAADVPVTPLTRLDFNVAGGIVRAIREERITTVVIGWHGEVSARAFIFGSVLDQLLRESREMVVVCRLHGPLATTRRIVLLLPPYVEREPAFAGALRAVKIVAKQTGAVLLVVTTTETSGVLLGAVQATKPDVPLLAESVERWDELVDALGEVVGPDDLLVLMTVRTGAVAWHPSLDRLPALLAGRFATNGLLTVYPAEARLRTLVDPAAPPDTRPLLAELDEAHVRLGLSGDEEAVLRALLDGGVPVDEATTDELLTRLRRGRSDDAVALRPGVAFYHAHTGRVRRSRLFVGVSREGLRLSSLEAPIHVVLVFLSPRAVPPEAYLRALAAVARFVHDAVDVDALRAAETPEEARAVLQRRLDAMGEA